jgi:hypothetical protein
VLSPTVAHTAYLTGNYVTSQQSMEENFGRM